MFNELRPFGLGRQWHFLVTVPWEIDEIQFAVDSIEVDRLRATGRVTGECQSSSSRKCINKTGFANVAASQESYLGQPVGGELLGPTGTLNEFCYQFYYT